MSVMFLFLLIHHCPSIGLENVTTYNSLNNSEHNQYQLVLHLYEQQGVRQKKPVMIAETSLASPVCRRSCLSPFLLLLLLLRLPLHLRFQKVRNRRPLPLLCRRKEVRCLPWISAPIQFDQSQPEIKVYDYVGWKSQDSPKISASEGTNQIRRYGKLKHFNSYFPFAFIRYLLNQRNSNFMFSQP